MTYSGDPSLAPDVRRRILSTFRQTLDLAAQGSHHEAMLGCDFILQMDPQFGPARALHERLNGAPGMAVEVDDLRAGVPSPDEIEEPVVDRDAEAEALFGDLDDVDLELSGDRPAAEPDPDLGARIAERLEVRDFSGVLELARQWPQAIAGDPELAGLVETATARQEAAPYVQRFLDSARRASAGGDAGAAEGMFEKARSLDPTHPGVRELGARLKAAAPPAAAPQPPAAAPKPSAPPEPSEPQLAALEPDRDGESAERISELLAEGQQQFDRGDYQGAIDAWSRIFLIDIDHDEANRRIEEARRLKAEQERQVEEVFHEASDRLEGGDRAAAQRGFEKVMELEPGHLAAREYLDSLAREEPAPPAAEAAEPAARPAPTPERVAGAQRVLKEEILVPPEDLEARPARPQPETRAQVAAVGPGGARRRFVVIGSAVLAVVVVAIALAFWNRDRLFPNASEVAPPTAAAVDPIARATRLHEGGKTTMAISQLRRLPPTDPHYEQAQALISQWEAGQQPAAGATDEATPMAFEMARRQDLIAAAVDAMSRNEHMAAAERLDQAASIAPLDEADAELRSRVTRALAPMAREIELFRQGEYEMSLPGLWRLHESDPGNPDLRRLIVDCYYNLAVRDLQRNDARAAAGKLDEAAALAPDDPVLARHRLFAHTYENREKDLQYRIYVKYLPFR